MRSKLLFLGLLAVGMLTLAGSTQANLLWNCSFEYTDNPYGDVATDWGDSSPDNGYYEVVEDGTAYDGLKYHHQDTSIGGFSVIFQHNRTASPGDECYMGGWVRDYGDVTTVGLKFEYYDAIMEMDPEDPTEPIDKPGHALDTDTGPEFDTAGTGDWEWFSEPGAYVAPAGTGSWSPVFVSMPSGSGGNWQDAGFDLDLLFAANYTASWPWTCAGDIFVHTPDPEHQAEGISYVTQTTLSWQRKSIEGRSPLCEVWYDVQDEPNTIDFYNLAVKLMNLADTNSIDLTNTLIGNIPLTKDRYYMWQVRFEDPNLGFWGVGTAPEDLMQTSIWWFDTVNRAPVIDAGLNVTKWTDSFPVKIRLYADVDDEGLPDPPSEVELTWTADPCSTAEFSDDKIPDPNVIITALGDYVLTLKADDTEKVSYDTVLIRVFDSADDRLVAHWKLDEVSGEPQDSEGGHHGTKVGDPTQGVAGQVDEAILLDGDGDYITIGDTGTDPNVVGKPGEATEHSWENQIEDGITVSAWMKLTDGWSKDWETLVGKGNHQWELSRSGDTGTDDGVQFNLRGQGTEDDATRFSAGAITPVSTANFDVTSGWHQVVGTFDGNKVVVYVDGLPAGSADAWFDKIALSPAPITIGTTTYLSDDADGFTPWNEDRSTWNAEVFVFGGTIDQVRIHDAAIPHWADYAESPSIVETYRTADGGHVSCGGVYRTSDLNQDCYTTLADFAEVAGTWLECNDIGNVNKDCD